MSQSQLAEDIVIEPSPDVKLFCSDCGRDFPAEELKVAWSREWAAWGTIREFLLLCHTDHHPCFNPAEFHSIPFYSSRNTRGAWDDIDAFVNELSLSSLRVSDFGVCQLIKWWRYPILECVDGDVSADDYADFHGRLQ